MAIEDAFDFAEILDETFAKAKSAGKMDQNGRVDVDVQAVLGEYWRTRFFRAASIHGMARMAALMASTYRAYFGEGLGPLSWIQKLKIPHYGRVAGRLVMAGSMPVILEWVLGGNVGRLDRALRGKFGREGGRQLRTGVEAYPEVDEAAFGQFLVNDDALLRASNAQWLLVPEAEIDPDDIYYVKSGQVITEEVIRFGPEAELEVYRQGPDFFLRRVKGCKKHVQLV